MDAPQQPQNHANQPYEVYNPLTGSWLLVSPQRALRPWQGQVETTIEEKFPEYDPACYLCPRNRRNNGEVNPDYPSTYSFTNDFSALIPPKASEETKLEDASSLFINRPESGICEVICYSPKHDLVMANMDQPAVQQVITLWQDRTTELGQNRFIKHVQIFENRGREMGSSNSHPHGQIWAQDHLPNLPAQEVKNQEDYFEANNSPLLLDYVHKEIDIKERVVYKNDGFAVVVPYWAVWPYETMILPLAQRPNLQSLSGGEVASLADALSRITKTYAALFQRPRYGAPYTLGIHQSPTDGRGTAALQMHIHFEPPLLTPEKQKYMVGYERFGQPQRDLTAFMAAATLRSTLEDIAA